MLWVLLVVSVIILTAFAPASYFMCQSAYNDAVLESVVVTSPVCKRKEQCVLFDSNLTIKKHVIGKNERRDFNRQFISIKKT